MSDIVQDSVSNIIRGISDGFRIVKLEANNQRLIETINLMIYFIPPDTAPEGWQDIVRQAREEIGKGLA